MEREILERPTELDGFASEIRAWIETELEKKKEWEERGETGEAYDAHADYIKPELLNETDKLYWDKLKNKTITPEDLNEYEHLFNEETAGVAPDEFESRDSFKALVRNKSIPIIVAKGRGK